MEPEAPAVPRRWSIPQQQGLACALCGRRLYRTRRYDTVTITTGPNTETVELWACAPDCETTPRPRGEQP